MKWQAVVSVLQNKDIDPNTKADQVDKIVTSIFDFKLMSKLVLGRKHWTELRSMNQFKLLMTCATTVLIFYEACQIGLISEEDGGEELKALE